MKALALAQTDAAEGKLSPQKQIDIRDTIEEIVEDLADYADEAPMSAEIPSPGDSAAQEAENVPITPIVGKDGLASDWQIPFPVLCVASRSPLDEGASFLLAQLLQKHGLDARVQPFSDVRAAKGFKADVPDARVVCLSYFGSTASPAHVRYLIRRLKRIMPQAKFLAGFWLLEKDSSKAEDWRASVGADFVATSLAEATALCVKEAMQAATNETKPGIGNIAEFSGVTARPLDRAGADRGLAAAI